MFVHDTAGDSSVAKNGRVSRNGAHACAGRAVTAMPPGGATPLRILHVTESARGGVGTYLNQTLPELHDWHDAAGRPGTMRVVIPAEHRFMLTHVPDDAVATYERGERGAGPLLRLAAASWREIRAFRPQVVHLHSTFAGLVVRPLVLLARLIFRMKIAVVYSPHGWAFQITGSRRRQQAIVAIERALTLLTDRIVVLSDAERRECLGHGFPAAKLVRIYNGISREGAEPARAQWHDERLKVFFVGRFDRQKGVDTLMTAAAAARDRMCVRCAGASVVDDGTPLAVPDNVELLGWLDEAQIAGQMALADVVAIPSRWEGFGLVAAEAMRARLPVVASRVGGLPEVVEDGVTGRLVPPDDPDALRDALLADGPAERARMADAGRARFLALFTARHSASQVGDVYREVLARLPTTT